MYCQKCGSEIPEGYRYCFKCGTPIHIDERVSEQNNGTSVHITDQQPISFNQEVSVKPKKKKPWKVLAIVFGVLLVLVIGAVAYMATHEPPWNETTESSETEEFNFESWDDFMAACKDIPYYDLIRNPKQYEGQFIHYDGTILEADGNRYIVAIDDDIDTLVCYDFEAEDDSRLLENDELEMYGKFSGLTTYTITLFGTSHDQTIPIINGYYVRWSGK